MWYLSFSLWLTSHSIIISMSIHVAINGTISFFSGLSNIPLYIHTTSFFIYSSVSGHLCCFPRTAWHFLTKLNILLMYDPILGVNSKELKYYVHTKTCTQIFIEALFIIAKTWKQPKCPSVYEWTNRLWSNQILEYCCCLVRRHVTDSSENPMDYSVPGSSVHEISQTRTLEWVAISFSRRSSWPRNQTRISCISRQILYHWATREAQWNFIQY